jgi:hypothetical protein
MFNKIVVQFEHSENYLLCSGRKWQNGFIFQEYVLYKRYSNVF